MDGEEASLWTALTLLLTAAAAAHGAHPHAPTCIHFHIQVCFICMEEGTAASPLVNGVCRCAHRPMHLACQRELASKTPAHAGGNCAVCNSRYTNVHTTSKLELSDAGRRCVVVTVGTIVLAAIGAFEISMYFVIGASALQMTYLVVGLIIIAVALVFVSRMPTPTQIPQPCISSPL